MPGLVPESEAESASTTGGDQAFSSTSDDGTTGMYGPPSGSHLDSFFDASGWTREDVMLLLMLFQAGALLLWGMEVRNA